MDATELELRRRISNLEEKLEKLQDEFEEKVTDILRELGIIERSAEDE